MTPVSRAGLQAVAGINSEQLMRSLRRRFELLEAIGTAAPADLGIRRLTVALGFTSAGRREVTTIRVLLVEDTRLAARRLATELAREDGIAIVGRLDFDDGVERLAAHFRPTVILFNTDYMVSQVLPVASELRVTIPGCAIVIVSDPDKRGMLPPRRRSPELSFVVKGTPVPVLGPVLRRYR